MGKVVLAYPYAKAAYGYAAEHDGILAWKTFLASLSSLISEPSVEAYLGSSSFVAAHLWEVFKQVFPLQSGEMAQENFFNVLADAHRIALAPEIYEVFERLCTEEVQFRVAEVTSARPLTESQKHQVIQGLKTQFGAEVELRCQEDPSCLAGLRVKVGDWMFDNTLQSHLDRLKNTLGETYV